MVTLAVRGSWNDTLKFDFLRSRLLQAYASQISAEIEPSSDGGVERIRFPLELR